MVYFKHLSPCFPRSIFTFLLYCKTLLHCLSPPIFSLPFRKQKRNQYHDALKSMIKSKRQRIAFIDFLSPSPYFTTDFGQVPPSSSLSYQTATRYPHRERKKTGKLNDVFRHYFPGPALETEASLNLCQGVGLRRGGWNINYARTTKSCFCILCPHHHVDAANISTIFVIIPQTAVAQVLMWAQFFLNEQFSTRKFCCFRPASSLIAALKLSLF